MNQFELKNEETNNKFKKNLDNFLNMMGNESNKYIKTAVMASILTSNVAFGADNLNQKYEEIKAKQPQEIILMGSTNSNTRIQSSMVKLTGDKTIDNKNLKAEEFMNIINSTLYIDVNNSLFKEDRNSDDFKLNALVDPNYKPLLSDRLRDILIKDDNNTISQEDKKLFANFIMNKNDLNEYLKVKNRFIELLETHNKNNEIFKVDTNIIDYIKSKEHDIQNLSNKNEILENLEKKNWEKSNNSEDFFKELYALKNAKLLSDKTLEIVNQFGNVANHRDNFIKSIKLDSNILGNNLEEIEKFNKIDNLYQESLNLVFDSVNNDLSIGIKERFNLLNSSSNMSFLEKDIERLNNIKNNLMTPNQKLLLDEKELYENTIIQVNRLIDASNEYYKETNQTLTNEQLSLSNINDMFSILDDNLIGLKSIIKNESLLKELKELKEINDKFNDPNQRNFLTSNLKEKIEIQNDFFNRVGDALIDINFMYKADFNELLKSEFKNEKDFKLIQDRFNSDKILPIQNLSGGSIDYDVMDIESEENSLQNNR